MRAQKGQVSIWSLQTAPYEHWWTCASAKVIVPLVSILKPEELGCFRSWTGAQFAIPLQGPANWLHIIREASDHQQICPPSRKAWPEDIEVLLASSPVMLHKQTRKWTKQEKGYDKQTRKKKDTTISNHLRKMGMSVTSLCATGSSSFCWSVASASLRLKSSCSTLEGDVAIYLDCFNGTGNGTAKTNPAG